MLMLRQPILMIAQEVTPFIMKANQCKPLIKFIRKMLDSHLLPLIALMAFFTQPPCSWSADDTIILDIKRKGGHVFSNFGQIVEINLNGHYQIDEAWIERISRERGMTDLSLEQTPIGDKEIKLFTHLKKLEWLNLYQTQITDEGLRTIAQLTRLKHLPLGKTRITNEGIKHLKTLSSIQYLGLRKTFITDKGLETLKSFKKLQGLHLGETDITNEGLKTLGTLSSLTKLWLHDTSISDEGLLALADLKKLRQLIIYNTKVTEKGYQSIQSMLPDCFILYQIED
jgi:Leucine-rich repeat (LRR) protein